MPQFIERIQGKKVTLMGLGLLGRGVGDAAFLAQCGAQVLITDMKAEEQLKDSVESLKAYPNITFRLGEHRTEDFTDCDMVIKAAGVRLDSIYIEAAKAAGVPVYMSTALFAQYAMGAGATIVGITGTRGKSTTTQMIYEGLKVAALRQSSGRETHVFLGGNVRGVSTLALLPQIKANDVVVLELDSWQLQGFGDLGISPSIAVFTNLMPDHQNYYPDMDSYFADKAKIFSHQKPGDVLIAGPSIAAQIKRLYPSANLHTPEMLPEVWHLAIPGEHNRENASLAKAALKALGVPEEIIHESLTSFSGVEGRLQFVREVRGVKIYNDNNATTPDATIAALKALDRGKNIILIMGGADKGLDMSTLLYEIAKRCKRVVLLAGTGTDKVAPLMADYSIFDSIETAVHEAFMGSVEGDSILFSPAFASFGLFKNEYDRNDQFLAIVSALQ